MKKIITISNKSIIQSFNKSILLPALLALATLAAAHAKTLYVKTDGDDSADGESWDSPYKTITKAIAAATLDSGDEIWIKAGTHKEGVALTIKNAHSTSTRTLLNSSKDGKLPKQR